MIDHIELRSRDLPASVRFYAAVLEPLGYRQSIDGAAKGFRDARGADFFLVAGEPADPTTRSAPQAARWCVRVTRRAPPSARSSAHWGSPRTSTRTTTPPICAIRMADWWSSLATRRSSGRGHLGAYAGIVVERRARSSCSRDSTLCTGSSRSTCGSSVRTPRAFGSKPR